MIDIFQRDEKKARKYFIFGALFFLTGERATRLQSCFSPGVIDLVGPEGKAVVKDARYDGCSRNVYRHEDLKNAVDLNKVRDHFIFTIESTGANEPEELFAQAVDVLEEKCDFFLKELDTTITAKR